MTWEAVSALGTVLTVVVIAVSAIFALRHVTQLRRATQLDGTMRIFAEFANPEFIAARSFVFCDLAEKLKDQTFTDELRSYRMDITKHPEYCVLLFLQLVGTLVKNRLVDGNAVYQFAQHSIVKSWEALEPVVRRSGCRPTLARATSSARRPASRSTWKIWDSGPLRLVWVNHKGRDCLAALRHIDDSRLR
jgi:hypothetical protein